MRDCNGFVVPGQSAAEYLHAQGIRESEIFVAPNAVDNDLFSDAAAEARRSEAANRAQLNLHTRYFLFVGRLVREKGVFELISAYAKLDQSLRRDFGLVFVGDGPCRQELEKQARSISPGDVEFVGFMQREELAKYYALAHALVLPTYTDTWGLVVNEAMACGLPVILSDVAGCAQDLLENNKNGLLVPSKNEDALADAMSNLSTRPDLCREMGAASAKRIESHSPKQWSNGVSRAVQSLVRTDD